MLVATLRSILRIGSDVNEPVVHTIGQGSRDVEMLVAALHRRAITFLCDVRSVPISNHTPEYCRDEFRETLRQYGITYVAMGDSLGGRPKDRNLYRNGFVDYQQLMGAPHFVAGIQRIVDGAAKGHRLAIFCAEGAPERCHRSKAVGHALERRGIRVVHIEVDDREADQETVIARLLPAPSLIAFGPDPHLTSRRQYH